MHCKMTFRGVAGLNCISLHKKILMKPKFHQYIQIRNDIFRTPTFKNNSDSPSYSIFPPLFELCNSKLLLRAIVCWSWSVASFTCELKRILNDGGRGLKWGKIGIILMTKLRSYLFSSVYILNGPNGKMVYQGKVVGRKNV